MNIREFFKTTFSPAVFHNPPHETAPPADTAWVSPLADQARRLSDQTKLAKAQQEVKKAQANLTLTPEMGTPTYRI